MKTLALFALVSALSTLAPSQDPPIELGGGVSQPKRISGKEPVYPRIAERAGVQGFLFLKIVVNAEGKVVDIRPVRSIPLLEQEGIESVKTWRYEPTMIDGVARPVTFMVTVDLWASESNAFDFYERQSKSKGPDWRILSIERLAGMSEKKRKDVLKILERLREDNDPKVAQAAEAALVSLAPAK